MLDMTSLKPDQLTCCGALVALVTAAVLGGCIKHPVEDAPAVEIVEVSRVFPTRLEKDVDILFVIDNSVSMASEQKNLARNFPRLIEALRTDKLAGMIPNVHIGVVSTDLGAGNFTVLQHCETPGGDAGRLQNKPRIAGCTPPKDAWISYVEGKTNIPAGAQDPVERVKEAFSCIAELGTTGCGFEQPLEAARKALDPKLNANPGFLRKDAYLAIVLITDEDDCSSKKPQLYDPNPASFSTLGPSLDFRCFEYGVQCDVNGQQPGTRTNCRPGFDWLHDVDGYVEFFKGLKPPGRVIFSVIAGPTDEVRVISTAQGAEVAKSCRFGNDAEAVPAIRIKAVSDAFDTRGQFSTICTGDFGPALERLGELIVANLHNCIEAPLLTYAGNVACQHGEALGTDTLGQPVSCQEGCLHAADCVVREVPFSSDHPTQDLPRCSPDKFNNTADRDCGGLCPCWRVITKDTCQRGGSAPGYALEILRRGEAPPGTYLTTKCQSSSSGWGSPELASKPQCH